MWPDPWIHLGGDEFFLFACWTNSTQLHKWMAQHGMASLPELQMYYETRLINFVVNTLNKRPVVWQEVFDEPSKAGLSIPKEVVVDVWKVWGPDTLSLATAAGNNVVYSACWYLDYTGMDWWAYYQCDPRGRINGTDEQRNRVLGGHASMWGERVDDTDFMMQVWPRASSTAEKLWTGNQTAATESARDRLARFRCRMVMQGVPASPIQPGAPCYVNDGWESFYANQNPWVVLPE